MTMTFVADNLTAASSDLVGDVPPSSDFVNLLKRTAKKANPRFRPFTLGNGSQWFVLKGTSQEIDALRKDPDIKMANDISRGAEVFADPFFLPGDVFWNGVVIREES